MRKKRSITLDEEIIKKVEKKAEKGNRSFSRQIEHLLKQAMR